jgi:hypothetical protein
MTCNTMNTAATSSQPTQKKRCFVVMGFGIKTDYATGRMLDLNKSYRLLIKPVVESKGMECVRADEIIHSGSIDVHMYNELLKADVVIADLSTANVNAFYELGIRHALRPYTTIVVSEDKLSYPFDLNHIKITSYTHLGNAIDFEEVERFRTELGKVLQEVLDKQKPDSPVYTYLDHLVPPALKVQIEKAAQAAELPAAAAGDAGKALSLIIDEGEEALDRSDFVTAKTLFESALIVGKSENNGKVSAKDPYLVQRLSLATYKSKIPDKITALYDALKLLLQLDLAHTNDPETVSLAGAIEKKLFEEGQGAEHLNNAILYYQRGYYLLNNRYNGINLAFSLNCRASSVLCTTREEQIADMIYANYTRKRVLYLCERDWEDIVRRENSEKGNATHPEEFEAQKAFLTEQKFWIQINKAEANFGLGDFAAYKAARDAAAAIEHADWMMEAFNVQIGKLRKLLSAKSDLLNPPWIDPDTVKEGKEEVGV